MIRQLMKFGGDLLEIRLICFVVPWGRSFEFLRKASPVDVLLGLERLMSHKLGELSDLSSFKLYLLSVKDRI